MEVLKGDGKGFTEPGNRFSDIIARHNFDIGDCW